MKRPFATPLAPFAASSRIMFPIVLLGVGMLGCAIGYAAHRPPPAVVLNVKSDREALRKILSHMTSDVDLPICGQTYGAEPLSYGIANGDHDRLAVYCPDRTAHVVAVH